MWLWNWWKNRHRSKIAKSAKLVANAKSIRDDRLAALRYLASCDKNPELVVEGLMARFSYSLEHGINDSREKEIAFNGILKHPEIAKQLAINFFHKSSRIAWPMKILSRLCQEDELREILLDGLDSGEVSFDQARVDKNYDILCYLAEYRHATITDKALHFLRDPDERVRFAAVEVLAHQNDPILAAPLMPYLSDESPENRRIRMSVIESFLRNEWIARDLPIGVPIVDGITVDSEGRLRRLT